MRLLQHLALVAFCTASAAAQSVAFTWDDLPAHNSPAQHGQRLPLTAMHTNHRP